MSSAFETEILQVFRDVREILTVVPRDYRTEIANVLRTLGTSCEEKERGRHIAKCAFSKINRDDDTSRTAMTVNLSELSENQREEESKKVMRASKK